MDRPGWIKATAEGMAVLTAPLTDRLAERRPRGSCAAVRSAGSQVGVMLGFLSGKVLGQFDPLGRGSGATGPLLLVAPNIVKVERELGADPTDFRLWVCLHESTHRLQFTAVPGCGPFPGAGGDFADKPPTSIRAEMLGRMVAAIKGGGTPAASWIEAIQSPEQRAVFDRLMALMTLLEGHADHVMDAVGPSCGAVRRLDPGIVQRAPETRQPDRSTGCCGRCSAWT